MAWLIVNQQPRHRMMRFAQKELLQCKRYGHMVGEPVSATADLPKVIVPGAADRLTLNVLLSFAQFEREVTGERIRDKIAASKKKGMWMGGVVPHGYRVEDRKLIIEGAEAKEVQLIFELYSQLKSIPALIRELDARGIRDKGSEACVWCQRRRHSIHHRHRRPAAGEPGLPRGDQSPGQELSR